MTAHGRRMLVAIVLIALVIVIGLSQKTAVDVLFHRVDLPPDSLRGEPNHQPESVISIHIDPETNATGIIDVSPPPPPPRPAPTDTARVRPEEPTPDPRPDLDLDDVLDGRAAPHGGASSAAIAAVPPRPIEITWPETRQLKQCIGASVSVRIRVSEEGRVKAAEVVPSGVLPACADAALAAARHIRFEPGRQGGIAVEMWTEVRIDFQRRD